MKEDISIEELCSNLPEYYARYLDIIRNMKFDEVPKYDELK